MDKTLYLFGDSLTRGVVLDKATGKYRLTKASFSSSLATDCQYNIVNCSKLGLTIEKGLSIMRQKTSQEGYAILEYGGNDCDFFWDQVASNPDFKTQKCKVPPERFLSLYRQAVEYLRSRNVSPLICTLPPIDAHRYFQWISRGLDQAAILSFLVTEHRIYTWQELYSQLSYQVAKEMGCPVLDLRRLFLQKQDYRQYLCDDGIHPNEEGHQLITSEVKQWLQRFFSQDTQQIA